MLTRVRSHIKSVVCLHTKLNSMSWNRWRLSLIFLYCCYYRCMFVVYTETVELELSSKWGESSKQGEYFYCRVSVPEAQGALRRPLLFLIFSLLNYIFEQPVSKPSERELGFSCLWLSLLSNLVLVQHILLTRGHSILLHTYVPYKTREGGWVHFPQPCIGLAIILSRSMSFLGKKVNNHK